MQLRCKVRSQRLILLKLYALFRHSWKARRIVIRLSVLNHGRFDRTVNGTNINNQTTNVKWSFAPSRDTFTFFLIFSTCIFFLGKHLGKIQLEVLKMLEALTLWMDMVKLVTSFTHHLLTTIRSALGKRDAPLSELKEKKYLLHFWVGFV